VKSKFLEESSTQARRTEKYFPFAQARESVLQNNTSATVPPAAAQQEDAMRISNYFAALAAPLTFVLVLVLGFAEVAEAAGKCNPAVQTCKQVVRALVSTKMKATCDRYGEEQEVNQNRCKGLDVRRGGNGKTLEQCAGCCVALRFDREHWRQCEALGLAPPVPEAKLAASEKRLCAQ
jgi:hypothetical protein